MPNEEHLNIIRQGVDAWNEWRSRNRNVIPDFSEADFSEKDLSGANLRNAVFYDENLTETKLARATHGRRLFLD